MEYTLQLIHRLEILIQEHVVDAGVEPADVQQNISKTIALQVKQILVALLGYESLQTFKKNLRLKRKLEINNRRQLQYVWWPRTQKKYGTVKILQEISQNDDNP